MADGEILFLTLYVDGILEKLKGKFTNNFEMKDLGEVSQY